MDEKSGRRRAKAWRAVLALAVLALIWGYNWVVMKEVLKYAAPFDFTALRTVFGTVTLFAALLWQGKPLRPLAVRPTILLGLLQTATFMGLVQWALVHGGAGKTAVLAYTMPFWMLVLGRLFLHERVRGAQWLAVGIAAGGLALILEPWRLAGSVMSSSMAVAAGLAWAAAAVLVKKIRSQAKVDLLSLTAWQMAFGALVLVVIALLAPSRPIIISGYFVIALAFNAVLCTGLAWLLWLFVLDNLPAWVAGLASLVVPAVGVLAAWIELGEKPSGAELLGMLLIALALLLLTLLTLRQTRRIRAGSKPQ